MCGNDHSIMLMCKDVYFSNKKLELSDFVFGQRQTKKQIKQIIIKVTIFETLLC